MSAPLAPPLESAFLRLPTEIRLEIFKYTDLVDLRQPSPEDHAIVYEGGILKPGHHAVKRTKLVGSPCTPATSCSWPLSRSLLLVNKQIYDEAREVFFEHHRFVLAAGHNANLRWLQSLPDKCRRKIRRIHFRFKAERHDLYEQFKDEQCDFDVERLASIEKAESIEDDDFEDPGLNSPGCCLICNTSGWDALVAYLTTSLNLAQLHLTVDLGQIYIERWEVDGYPAVRAAAAQRAICRMSRPLITQLQGRVKSLFVFLPVHFELESSIEKSVMGTDFDALRIGKIPPGSRCYWRPYALPDSRLGRRISGPPQPPNSRFDIWARPQPRPPPLTHWSMRDLAQDTISVSQSDDLDKGYAIKKSLERNLRVCSTREVCDEEIKLVIHFKWPDGKVSAKEF